MAFRNNIEFIRKQLSEQVEEQEKKAFTIDGVELGEVEKIRSEFIKLTATFAFDCDLEYEEYKDVNIIIQQLEEFILNIEYDKTIFAALKKLIVYLDLQINSKVSFYSTFKEMLLNNELKYDYTQLKKKNMYNFKNLMTIFYKNSYIKKHDFRKDVIVNDKYNYDNNFTISDSINKLFKDLEYIKKTDFQKYSNYKNILLEIISKVEEIQLQEDIDFIRKVIAYIEYSLEQEVKDKSILIEMIQKEELVPDYNNLIFGENIDLEYLKELFHYDGILFQERRMR